MKLYYKTIQSAGTFFYFYEKKKSILSFFFFKKKTFSKISQRKCMKQKFYFKHL